MGKCACTVFGRDEGCPSEVKAQHGWTTRVVIVVLLLKFVVFELRFLAIQSFSVDVVFALGRYGSF